MTLHLLTGFITKLIRKITLNRVAILSFTVLSVIFFFTLYENKTELVSHFTAPSATNKVGETFNVSVQTQQQLKLITEGETIIAGVSILSADLRLNQSHSVFFFVNDQVLLNVLANAERSGKNVLPIFTNNHIHNAEIIKLINGTFSCVSFDTTLVSKIYPELSQSVKAICRAGIPSYYGYFSGYIEVYLTEYPKIEKSIQLEHIFEGLADDIYLRDVIPTQRYEKVGVSRR